MAGVVACIRFAEKIGVIHRDPAISASLESASMPLPLWIMVCDLTKLELAVVAENAPGKVERFNVSPGQNGAINLSNRRVIKRVSLLSNEPARIRTCAWIQSFRIFGHVFCF